MSFCAKQLALTSSKGFSSAIFDNYDACDLPTAREFDRWALIKKTTEKFSMVQRQNILTL